MRIAIIGAGAMGSLFGAILSSKADISLVDVFEEHVQTINQKGLIVQTVDQSQKTYLLNAFCRPEDIRKTMDAAIVFTKSYHTSAAAKSAKKLLSSSGIALTLQNGLGNLDILEDILGAEHATAGVTAHGATLLGPGHIRHAGQGPTYLDGKFPGAKEVANLFNLAGIQTHLSEDLDSLIWGKLIINAGINALAAILRVPNGMLSKKPACEKILVKVVEEAVSVAHALGVKLPWDDPVRQVKQVCEATAENRASMLQDILRGSQTEIDFIHGAIAEKGAELGIQTPYTRFLRDVVSALEATSFERIARI